MPPQENYRRNITTTSGLRIRTNFREQTSRGSRAGIVAMGVGEIFVFGETVLGLAVISLGLFAGRQLRRRNVVNVKKGGEK